MSKILICPSCGKESPRSGITFKDNDIKQALSAPLDCTGAPQYDFSRLSGIKKANCCYWCNANIDKIEADRKADEEADRKAEAEADRKAKREAERKAKAEANRKAEAEVDRKAKVSSRRKNRAFGFVVAAVAIIGLVLFFCLRSSGPDSSPNSDTYLETTESAYQADESNESASDGQTSLQITDYSKEWTALENRLAELGAALDYVNVHSGEAPSKIKDDAYKLYSSIKDDAYNLYQKIKDEHYARYQKLKDSEYEKYNKIKDEAYKRYKKGEIDYSEYSSIQSEAYDEYSSIQSSAYNAYIDVQSDAYDRYSTLQSDAYDWQSNVRSIANGL